MKPGFTNRYIPSILGWLIVLEGFANILMGILPQFNLSLERVLISYVSFFELQQVSSILAIMIGLAFVALGRRLVQRSRSAWQITVIFLLFTVANSIFPSVFLPTFIYTLLMLFLLIAFRSSFRIGGLNNLPAQQWLAIASVTFVLVYGTVGTYLLRDQYRNLHDWIDAIYYSLETYTTIGYGDITPITDNAKIFTCSMIIIGVSTFIAAIGVILGPIFDHRLKGVLSMVNRSNNLKAHVVIFGANPMALHTGKLLKTKGDDVVFIDGNSKLLSEAEHAGFKVILGEASKEDVLIKTHIAQARALICASTSDAENILLAMAADVLRQKDKAKFDIIVRIDEPEYVAYAKKIGADQVISPSMLMGDSISKEIDSTN